MYTSVSPCRLTWCVWVKKIQIDVFISHIPAPHRLCASCPLPPMTQCPSAPKTHTHTMPWLSPDQSSAAVYLQPWENGTTALILSCVSITLHTRRLTRAENWVGIWRKVNFKHKGKSVFSCVSGKGVGGGLLSWESGPQKPPCVRVQPWNQPDPIDSVYLARLQVKAIGNLGEIWRGLWIHREREGEGGKWAKKKKVILSALQSGKAGVFSDQPLTRLMVIFLHRRRFTVKVSRLPAAFLSLFTLPSFCFSSSPLLVNGVPADASLCFVLFSLPY